MLSPTSPLATATIQHLRDQAGAATDWIVDLTRQLIAIDSPIDAPEGIKAVLVALADALADVGTHTWYETNGVPHLRITVPAADNGSADVPTVIILGHADTVYPVGTADARPYTEHHTADGRRATGAGVADMKCALATAAWACRTLAGTPGCPTIELVIVGDEETRSCSPPVLDELSHADACLVLECGRPGGGYVHARKAGAWLRIDVAGRSAHAGVAPETGSNAIVKLAALVGDIDRLDRPDGLSAAPGTIGGGTAINVVPDQASVGLDVRAVTTSDLDAYLDSLEQLVNTVEGATLTDLGHWPALQTEMSAALGASYEAIADALGVATHPVATGGMSDGCWTAAAGIATLDGLGPEGADDHSPTEYLIVDTIPERAALLASLVLSTARNNSPNRNHQVPNQPDQTVSEHVRTE